MNRSITILSGLICSILLCFAVYAADWKEIEDNTSFDVSQIVETKRGTLLVWIKQKLALSEIKLSLSLATKYKKDVDYTNYSYSATQYEVNCNMHEFRTISGYDYDIGGNVLNIVEFNENSFSPVIPDSIAEYCLDEICNYAKEVKSKR